LFLHSEFLLHASIKCANQKDQYYVHIVVGLVVILSVSVLLLYSVVFLCVVMRDKH